MSYFQIESKFNPVPVEASIGIHLQKSARPLGCEQSKQSRTRILGPWGASWEEIFKKYIHVATSWDIGFPIVQLTLWNCILEQGFKVCLGHRRRLRFFILKKIMEQRSHLDRVSPSQKWQLAAIFRKFSGRAGDSEIRVCPARGRVPTWIQKHHILPKHNRS